MSKKAIECIDCKPGIPVESLRDRLIVNDKVAHIPGLEAMVDEVLRMKLPTLHQAADEMMRRVTNIYKVPPGEESKYRQALLDYYESRATNFI